MRRLQAIAEPTYGLFKVRIHYARIGIAEAFVAAVNDIEARRIMVDFELAQLSLEIFRTGTEAEERGEHAPEVDTSIKFCETELVTWIDLTVDKMPIVPPGAGLHVFQVRVDYSARPAGPGIVVAAVDDQIARREAVFYDHADRFPQESLQRVQVCETRHIGTIQYSGFGIDAEEGAPDD